MNTTTMAKSKTLIIHVPACLRMKSSIRRFSDPIPLPPEISMG
jgi:hypothetical protein